ncbi:MAG: sugar phosphate isomerase/epimerase [Ruminococcaceae bacterium]|nr:sugar phosphate isomerase/epimerase [Oscillospiraceae bacterium]
MKIGISSYSFSKHLTTAKCGYIEICDLAKKMGYDGIEFIDLINEDWGITGDPIEIAKEINAHCKKIGLDIIAYTVGANFLHPNPEEQVEKLKKCIDICEALGAPIMRHDAASNPEKFRKEPLYNYRTAIKEIAPYIRKVTEYAAKKGIKTCVENHGFFFQDPKRVEELILAVNHENYGWLCDIGNFLCADSEPSHATSIAAPYAFHIHVKDFIFKPGTEQKPSGEWITTNCGNYIRGTIIGHGAVPVQACINALKKAGYDGYISVEFEGIEENLPSLKMNIEFLHSII